MKSKNDSSPALSPTNTPLAGTEVMTITSTIEMACARTGGRWEVSRWLQACQRTVSNNLRFALQKKGWVLAE